MSLSGIFHRGGLRNEKAIFRRANHQDIGRSRTGSGQSIRDVCRRHNLTEQTFFRWRNRYGAMAVSEVRRLKELEVENSRLKKIVAEQARAIDGLREIAGKKY